MTQIIVEVDDEAGVNIGSDNGLLPDGTQPLAEPITFHLSLVLHRNTYMVLFYIVLFWSNDALLVNPCDSFGHLELLRFLQWE